MSLRVVRLVVVVATTVVAAAAVYLGLSLVQVWRASNSDAAPLAVDATPLTVDAVVVLGAAQWDGEPSPVFKGRLDHAADLWRAGVAPVVVVAGGKQQGDRVTQGFAAYDYLRDLGLPDEAVLVEVDGTDTYSELAAASSILTGNGRGTNVVLVTDGYHAKRSELVAAEVGLDAVVSPASLGVAGDKLVRETAAVALGRLVGFRRLSNWMSN